MTPGTGSKGQDRPRGLGDRNPEELAEPGRSLDGHRLPHVEAWGKFEVSAHQTDPARNSVFYDPALNKKFPYLEPQAGQQQC